MNNSAFTACNMETAFGTGNQLNVNPIVTTNQMQEGREGNGETNQGIQGVSRGRRIWNSWSKNFFTKGSFTVVSVHI